MTVWLLVYAQIVSGSIAGVALIAPFPSEIACNEARRKAAEHGLVMERARCLELSLGEDA